MTEPHLLVAVPTEFPGRLLRVSRPGRGACGSQERVSDEAVIAWVEAVREGFGIGSDEILDVEYVCLLGTKRKGRSEIAGFYPARAPWETSDAPLFEDFLNRVAAGRARFRVHHVPTVDGDALPPEVVGRAEPLLRRRLETGGLVLVGCSAAERRSVELLRAIDWVEPLVH